MTVYQEHLMDCWTGVHEQDVGKYHIEYLGLREKSSSTDLFESLEHGDRIYLYHQKKQDENKRYVLNGRFIRRGTSATDVSLIVTADKRKGNPRMILSYDNLKLFFRSNFMVDVYRLLDENPNKYYPKKLNGVETPLVPY